MRTSDPSPASIILELVFVLAVFYLPLLLTDSVSLQTTHSLESTLVAAAQAATIIVALKARGKSVLTACGFRAMRYPDVLAAVGVVTLLFGLHFILSQILGSPSFVALPESSLKSASPHLRSIPLGVGFILATGYKEEIFFRGYLVARLQYIGIPVIAALSASTLLFGIGHLYQGYGGLCVASAQALVLAGAFLLRKNIHTVALAHAAYNACVIFLVPLLSRALPSG